LLLSVKDTASRLGSSPGLVYSLVAGRRLRYVRIGHGRGRIRIPEDAVDEYLARSTVAPQEPKEPPSPRVRLKHLRL
jgi:excisionase family DNA binding protein